MTKRIDPTEIETELAREREDLAATLALLRQRLTSEEIADEALTAARQAGQRTMQTVRDHPWIFALAGAGLAALLFSRGRSSRGADEKIEAAESRARVTDSKSSEASAAKADDGSWLTDPATVRAVASLALEEILRHSDWIETEGKAALAGGIEAIEAQADAVRSLAETVGSTLRHGLDELPDKARDAVVEARKMALEARLAAASATRQTLERSKQAAEAHPLAAAATALAVVAVAAIAIERARRD